jgi:hypothetical protein
LARWIVLAFAALCTACPDEGEETDGGEETGDPMPDPPPAPAFVEPASDRLDIPIDRNEDVALSVAGIVPGTTRILIDSVSRGTLPASDPFATLTSDTLVLRLRGAMVEGGHTMQLVNDGADDPLLSRSIDVHLVASPPADLVLETYDQAIGGRALAVHGVGGDQPLLLILDQLAPAAPVLHIVPAEGARWAYDLARTIPVFGYRRGPGEPGLAIAAQRCPGPDGGSGRLRVAWRVGYPGRAVALAEAGWDTASLSTPSIVAMDLDPQVLGPYEYAELGRPMLVGDTLVVEAYAATDVESPRPGDRALLSASLRGVPIEIGAPQRVSVGPRVDLDRLGPVVEPTLSEVGAAPAVAARLDGVRAVVLVADPGHGRLELRPGVDDDVDLTFASVSGPLATFVGGFGSRQVLAFDALASPPVAWVQFDDWGNSGAVVRRVDRSDLPSDPVGEPAVGLLDGTPIVVIPYGETEPTFVLRPTDGKPRVDRFEVSCSQVALAADPRAAPGTSVSLACVQGEMVLDARLRPATGD